MPQPNPKTVIFTDRLSKVELAAGGSASMVYVVLNEVPEANRIRAFFERDIRFGGISKEEIVDSHFKNLKQSYIDFIGKLNVENSSLFWWAYFVTNKNPTLSPLFYDVAGVLVLSKILQKEFDILFVITDRREILRQTALNVSNSSSDIKVRGMITGSRNVFTIVRDFTPIFILSKFFRTLYFKLLIAISGLNIEALPGVEKEYTVVKTVLTEDSFTDDNIYRDIYFGELVDFMERKGMPLIVAATISGNYRNVLERIKAAKTGAIIIPVEKWITTGQSFEILYGCLKSYFSKGKVNGILNICGVDVSWLIRNSMRYDLGKASFYSHIRIYYAMKSMAGQLRIKKFIYPMENRPWERIMIYGLRAFAPNCRITGYQHASIGPKHMNFIFTDGERNVTPFPDGIITMGDSTRRILEKECNVPKDIITTGCALRYMKKARPARIKDKPRRISNVLVALASNVEEYIEALLFLERALGADGGFNVKVRPHPAISIDGVVKNFEGSGFKFEVTGKTPLKEDLDWGDIVIYVSSTVSLEALASGIPVIFLDVDPFLNRDPLHDMSSLKWSVSDPAKLRATFKAIEDIGDEEYSKMRQDALSYIGRYMAPVTEECMEKFI